MENKKIYAAMVAVSADIDSISKNRKNDSQGFKFRGIDDLYNALHGLLAKHKVFSLPTIISENREERTTKGGTTLFYQRAQIKYTFYADDGSSVECTVLGEGMDSGDKASNKAMAIAHKYALLQAFTIPTESNDDPDEHTPPPVLPKSSPKVTTKLQSKSVDTPAYQAPPEDLITLPPASAAPNNSGDFNSFFTEEELNETKNPVEDLTPVGTRCSNCNTIMKPSKSGQYLYCPNFKDDKNGKHPTVRL